MKKWLPCLRDGSSCMKELFTRLFYLCHSASCSRTRSATGLSICRIRSPFGRLRGRRRLGPGVCPLRSDRFASWPQPPPSLARELFPGNAGADLARRRPLWYSGCRLHLAWTYPVLVLANLFLDHVPHFSFESVYRSRNSSRLIFRSSRIILRRSPLGITLLL